MLDGSNPSFEQVGFSIDTKEKLRRRSGSRCEYCRTSLIGLEYKIACINPKNVSVAQREHNLAFCCVRCYTNKGDNIGWTDPHTNLFHLLYHPIQQCNEWQNHFQIQFNEVIGITDIGRATASLLFRHVEDIIPKNLDWWLIEPLRNNETLYSQLNQLQYYRSKNLFDLLQHQLTEPLRGILISPDEEALAKFAVFAINMELCVQRSTLQDVNNGILLCSQAFKYFGNNLRFCTMLYEYLTYLYEQRATFYSLNQIMNEAKRDIWLAHQYAELFRISPFCKDGTRSYFSSEYYHKMLRDKSKLRFHSFEPPSKFLDSYYSMMKDSAYPLKVNYYKSFMDYLVFLPRFQSKLSEKVYMEASTILERGGYGTSSDIHHMLNIRRRWWVLRLIFEENPNLDLLLADLNKWKELQQYNETRELLFAVYKAVPLIREKHRIDVVKLVKKFYYA